MPSRAPAIPTNGAVGRGASMNRTPKRARYEGVA
ncbi:MAG: hypothetical protein JWM38_1706 [Sphingomonas bacterium]|jgi:hypothetical protein|nr:hypothetical protein [Sphingomonas bacterium]MDB5718279.1 hypothetical protein [Sphingomonas bacterium]